MSQTKAQLIAGTPTQDVIFNDATVNSLNGGPLAGTRNRIINGDMRIDQRNAGASVTLTTPVTYTVDRWFGFEDTDGGMTAQQSSTSPSDFVNSLVLTVTSADASLAATQRAFVGQRIEGFNISDLNWGTANAKSVILSFWVRSSLTGTFGGAIKNGAFNRSYPFDYSISSANTWEYKSVAIPGDTTGTWNTDNTTGFVISFGLGVGSTYSGTAGAWAAADYNSVTGAVSVIGTNGATFYVTGVQLEAGSVATPFERRSYGQELALCQRYYQDMRINTGGVTSSGIGLYGAVQLPVVMRAAPTAWQESQLLVGSVTSITLTVLGAEYVDFTLSNTSGGSGIGSATYELSAEL